MFDQNAIFKLKTTQYTNTMCGYKTECGNCSEIIYVKYCVQKPNLLWILIS